MDNPALIQNTPEWLEMRRNKVGASDAPIIMEASPWTTPYQLWQQKLGLVPKGVTTERMARGTALEDLARQELEKLTGLLLFPKVCFHASISYMMASIDAMDSEGKYAAEIKCPSAFDHAKAQAGHIPDKYIPQLQHQLEVCQLEKGYYFSFDGSQGVVVEIYRDDKYIKKLLKKEKEFWECLQEFVAPDLTEKDYVVKNDPSWLNAAIQWKTLSEQIETLEDQKNKLKDFLISMAHNHNSMGAGVKVSKVIRKGNVDYSKIPELSDVNLEAYRKNPIEYWKII